MELGIIVDHNGYERFGDEKYKKLKEHGFSAADYNMSNVNAGVYILSEEDAVEMIIAEKKLADDAGIKINQVHGPWDARFIEKTEEGRREHMRNYERSIRYTKMLGCKNWVIHPLLPCGGDEIDTPDEKITWDVNYKFFKELVEIAKKNDVIICFENMPFLNYSLSKPEKILEFVQLIDDDNFRICFDTGHAATFKELSVGDEVRRLKDKIQVFHIHDTIYEKDVHLFPYSGVTDWVDFAKALKEIDYKGVFSLETQPSRKLPEVIFEDMSKILVRISKDVISHI